VRAVAADRVAAEARPARGRGLEHLGRKSGRSGERSDDCECQHRKGAFHGSPFLVETRWSPPAPVTATDAGVFENPSVSVLKNAVTSVISCSVNAGASPGPRSNGGSRFTLLRYSAGRSSYSRSRFA